MASAPPVTVLVPPVPAAPFSDAAELKTFMQEAVYNRDLQVSFASLIKFWGMASMEEVTAVPTACNSGKLGTFQTAWIGLFTFVDFSKQWVNVDDVFIGDDGYAVLFWGRWHGACNGSFTFADGTKVDLAGKTFANLRYAYKLTFGRTTNKVEKFEGLFDASEFGRLLGSPEYARTAGQQSIYPA